MAGENGRNEVLELLCQLENLCSGFNFTKLEAKLNECWSTVGQYLDLKPDVIRSIARKSGLPPSLILVCVEWLCNKLESHENGIVARNIAQAVRYSIRNYENRRGGTDTDFREKAFRAILGACRKFNDPEVRSQLAYAMGYLLPNLNASTLPSQLQEFICNDNISTKAKEFLRDQIRRKNCEKKSVDLISDSSLPNFGSIELPQNVRNRVGVYVTHTQSTVAVKSNHFESEKTNVLILNLCEAFKAKRERLKSKDVRSDRTPNEENIKLGSDTAWYRDTYGEVKNLLQIAESNCVDLRHEDVNVYLAGKLLGYHFWTWSWGGKAEEQLNVDISKIIFLYSKSRTLDDAAIDKLIKCLSPMLTGFSKENLGTLRYNAIQGLYNCSLRKNIFFHEESTSDSDEDQPIAVVQVNSQRLDVVRNCQKFEADCAKRPEIISVMFKILNQIGADRDELLLFELALQQLEANEASESEIESHLHNIMKQTWHPDKVEKYFTTEIKDKLINFTVVNDYKMKIRIGCAEIIHSYLSCCPDEQSLSFESLKKLLSLIKVSVGNEVLFRSIFPVLIIAIEKGCRSSKFNSINLNAIADKMVDFAGKLEKDLRYFSILALAKIVDQENVTIAINENLTHRLFDETKVDQKGNCIKFIKQDSDNLSERQRNGVTISHYVADIILKSLRNLRHNIGTLNIKILLDCLEKSGDKQTRICAAEIIYLCRGVGNFYLGCSNEEIKAALLSLTTDAVVDVKVLSIVMFTFFVANRNTSISDECLKEMSALFEYDRIYLGENDYTEEVNQYILTVFKCAALEDKTFPESAFEMFNFVLEFDKSTSAPQYVEMVLYVLETLVLHKKQLPSATMFALENVLCHENGEAKKIFHMCIRNGQSVPNAVLELLVHDLYSDFEETRSEAFALLSIADKNQDLSDKAYEALEIEMAGRIYGPEVDIEDVIASLKFLLERVNTGKKLTPFNFTAFGEILGTREELTILIINILAVVEEYNTSIPDFLLNKLTNTLNCRSDRNVIPHFCQLISAVLKNNQIGTNSKPLKIKLELFLEFEVIESELFVEVFQVLIDIIENSAEFMELSDATLLKLTQQILTDQLCRKKHMKTFLSILKKTKSENVTKHAKMVFKHCLSSKEQNISLYSVLGLSIISEKCRSNLDLDDVSSLLQFALESEDVEINKRIVHLVDQYDLTQEDKIKRDRIVSADATKDFLYYFGRLKNSEREENFDYNEVGKSLFCLKDIFATTDLAIINEAVNLLKRLSMDKSAVMLITPDIIKSLLQLKQLDSDQHLPLLVHGILKDIIDNQNDRESNVFSVADIDRLCELADLPGNKKKYFRALLESILRKCKLPEASVRKIEMNLYFVNNKINSLENVEHLCGEIREGSSLTFKQRKEVIEEVLTIVKEQEKLDRISETTAKMLLTFVDLMTILLTRGEINMNELQACGDDVALIKVVEYVLAHQNWMPVQNENIVSGCLLILEHVTNVLTREFSVFCGLIPYLVSFYQDTGLEKFKIVTAQYIFTCIKCCKKDSIDIDLSPHVVSWLQNGLRDNSNIIRMLSFDSLRILHFSGRTNAVFEEWSSQKLEEFSSITKITIPDGLNDVSLEILRTISFAKFINSDFLKDISPSKVRYEILIHDLIERCSSMPSYLKFYYFSYNFSKLSSQEFYIKNSELFCNILESLILSMDQGQILASEMKDIVLFLVYVNYENFLNIIKSPEKGIWKKLQKEALSTIILEKLDESLKNLEITLHLVKSAEDTKIEFDDMSVLLSHIDNINSVENMKAVFEFCKDNNVHTKELSLEQCENPLSMLKKLHACYLPKAMSPEITKTKAISLLSDLFKSGFAFTDLKPLFLPLEKVNAFSVDVMSESIIAILTLIYQFGLDPKRKESMELIEKICNVMKENPRNFSCWFQKANLLIVELVFKRETDVEGINSITKKSLSRILEELRESNFTILDDLGGQSCDQVVDYLESMVQKIKRLNECTMVFKEPYEDLLREQKRCVDISIDSWQKEEYVTWAKAVQKAPELFTEEGFVEEALAVLLRANFKCYNYRLNDTQILSCLFAVKYSDWEVGKGLLQQVVTGGGKSTIIRLLAILLALKGQKVFVVTSNPVLAERDARDSRSIFTMFNLTVDDNRDKQNYIKGIKTCYTKSVVYGDASQFQFDILRHEYSCLETLGNWKLDVVIVDEVDNMFIDDSSKFTRLASTIPGMDQLQLIYHFLWNKLTEIQNCVFSVDERTFLAFGRLELNDSVLSIDVAFKDGDILRIENLREYILGGSDTTGLCIEITGDVSEGISKHLTCCLLALLTDNQIEGYETKLENRMKIPKHFHNFVINQIPRWVENAMTALQYIENVHYIVDQDTIKPVDFDTTGVIQSSTSWSDGLHQFLQIKHNLPMTSENLATNYLSTVGFFKRFDANKKFGFTGTFGSKAAQEYISDLYNVDLIEIPNSSIKRYFHYKDLVLKSKKEWVSSIVQSALFEIKKNRACLIICRSIRDAETLYRVLCESVERSNSVKLYTSNLSSEEKHVEKIGAGEIIVATNLAGRGTDIKTEKAIENNGGLHVCMTFLPPSQRAEDQAIGRTSRLDNLGTAQFILLGALQSNSNLREERDKNEKLTLQDFKEQSLKIISIKDALFKRFCDLLKFIREKLTVQKTTRQKVSSFFGRNVPSVYETNILSAVEERWALFVRHVESMSLEYESDRQVIYNEFNTFESEIKSVFENSPNEYIQVIKSPYYAICIGNDFIANGKSEEAMEYFNYAINLDPTFSSAAFVGKAWCLVSPYTRFLFLNGNYLGDYKVEAMKALETAVELLETEKSYLATSHILTLGVDGENSLAKQLLQKLNIIGNYINSIQVAFLTIKKSQRLVDICYKTKAVNDETMVDCETHFERQRSEESLDDKFNSNNYSIDLTFHHLTARYDCGVEDQAIDLIIKSLKFNKSLRLQLTDTDSESILVFLSPHLEYRLLSKEGALEKLGIKANATKIQKMKSKALKFIPKLEKERTMDCTIFKANGEEEKLFQKPEPEIRKKVLDCDDVCTFNLKYYDVNECYTILSAKTFELSLLQVSKEQAQSIFSNIDTDICDSKMTMKIIGKSRDVVDFCSHRMLSGRSFRLVDKTGNNIETVKSLLINQENLQRLSGKFSCVEISLTAKNASKLFNFDGLMKVSLDISYTNLSLSSVVQLAKAHKEGRINLTIHSETKSAKEIIPLLRETNFEFSVKFLDFDYFPAKLLLINANRIGEEDIVVDTSLTKRLPSLFLHEHDPKEIVEFMLRGLEYLLVFNEKNFVPWNSIISVCMLGVLQMAVGGLLMATGFGAPLGMALFTEGAADVVLFGGRTYFSRNFSWKDYGIQKSVSLAISAVSLGLGAFKDAGKGVQSLVQGLGSEVGEQGVVKIFMNGENIYNAAVKSASALKSLALKQMGASLTEVAARETLFQISNNVSTFLFHNFEDTIETSISRSLKIAISKTQLLQILSRLNIYEKYVSQKMSGKNIVSSYLEEIVSPENNFWKTHWNSIGMMICQGVGASSQSLNNPIALGARLFSVIWGSVEIANMQKNLCDELVRKLIAYEELSFTLVKVIQLCCNISPGDAKIFEDIIARHCGERFKTFSDFLLNSNWEHVDRIPVSEFRTMECFENDGDVAIAARSQFMALCHKVAKETTDSQNNSFDTHSEIVQSIVNTATQQIVQVSNAQLITPVSSLAIGHFVRKVSNFVQAKYIVSTEHDSVTQTKYANLMEKYAKGESLSDEEHTFISNHKDLREPMTIAKQIHYNARDLQTAKGFIDINRSMTNNIKNPQSNTKDDHLDKYATKVESTSKGAGLLEITHLSQVNNCKLVITDSVSEIDNLLQKHRNHNVLVYNSNAGANSSFALYDANGKLVNVSDKGDKGYRLLEHLTGKTETDLRKCMANDIRYRNNDDMKIKIKAENLVQKYQTFGQQGINKSKPSGSFSNMSKGFQVLGDIIGNGNSQANSNNVNVPCPNVAVPNSDGAPEIRDPASSVGIKLILCFFIFFLYMLYQAGVVVLTFVFAATLYLFWRSREDRNV